MHTQNIWTGLDTQDALNITLSNQFCGGYIDPLFLNATGYIDATGVQQPDAKGYICPLGQICLVVTPSVKMSCF
jgi:hypothetical protein